MDTSYQFFNNPSSSSLCIEKQRSCSTAQNCLFKILRTISNTPPENTTKVQSLLSSQLKEPQFGVKTESINGFCVSPENQESESPATGNENSGGFFRKCEFGKEEKLLGCESCSEVGVTGGFSGTGEEIIGFPATESNEVFEKTSKMGKLEEEKGFMGLLIEAARLIFGEFKDEGCEFESESEKKIMESHSSGSRTMKLKRRNKCWGTESVAGKCSSLPVVRSKRGRIQVLPYKYRDSIIEPVARFSRNRSTVRRDTWKSKWENAGDKD
ncbi:hypothetical protein RND71_020848 [Anisodus tanguticus]|uniref:Uncharacterized protein n=1 Tax=Anisodus tanguticus TaxID=243964 RepID=A0AAE1RU59_9SOLA|nr:hypothetical protein RND71_020848 [Anisodus tanguticus]